MSTGEFTRRHPDEMGMRELQHAVWVGVDPATVGNASTAWRTVSNSLGNLLTNLQHVHTQLTEDETLFTGRAGEAYRTRMTDVINTLGNAQTYAFDWHIALEAMKAKLIFTQGKVNEVMQQYEARRHELITPPNMFAQGIMTGLDNLGSWASYLTPGHDEPQITYWVDNQRLDASGELEKVDYTLSQLVVEARRYVNELGATYTTQSVRDVSLLNFQGAGPLRLDVDALIAEIKAAVASMVPAVPRVPRVAPPVPPPGAPGVPPPGAPQVPPPGAPQVPPPGTPQVPPPGTPQVPPPGTPQVPPPGTPGVPPPGATAVPAPGRAGGPAPGTSAVPAPPRTAAVDVPAPGARPSVRPAGTSPTVPPAPGAPGVPGAPGRGSLLGRTAPPGSAPAMPPAPGMPPGMRPPPARQSAGSPARSTPSVPPPPSPRLGAQRSAASSVPPPASGPGQMPNRGSAPAVPPSPARPGQAPNRGSAPAVPPSPARAGRSDRPTQTVSPAQQQGQRATFPPGAGAPPIPPSLAGRQAGQRGAWPPAQQGERPGMPTPPSSTAGAADRRRRRAGRPETPPPTAPAADSPLPPSSLVGRRAQRLVRRRSADGAGRAMPGRLAAGFDAATRAARRGTVRSVLTGRPEGTDGFSSSIAAADRYMRMVQTARARRRAKDQQQTTGEEQAWQGKDAAPAALDTPAPAELDPVQPALRPPGQPSLAQ